MAEGARIESTDVLREFKIALIKFQESATLALGDAESELHRVLTWLTHEQDSFWQHQIRKREEVVMRCKEAVRMKKIFKDSAGRPQSAIEEEKALKTAMRNLEEAQQKLMMVRKWARVLPKEIEMYKGGVQRLSTTVDSLIPVATSHLEKLSQKIEAYAALQAAAAAGPLGAGSDAAAAGGGAGSMGRGAPGQIPGMSGDDLGKLIEQSPAEDVRAAAPEITELKLSAPTVPPDHQAPAMLPITPRLLPGEQARLWVADGAEKSPRLFLHRRTEVTSPEDGGWSILPLEAAGAAPMPVDDGTARQWRAMRLGDLLRSRPDLTDLLGLPPGFSVIIDSSGISDVIDAKRQPTWRRA